MLRLTLTGFLLIGCAAQSAAQPLAFRAQPANAMLVQSNAPLFEVAAQQALQTGISNCRSPFGIKFLCGLGGLTLSSIVGALFLRNNPEDNLGLTAVAFLLASAGCAAALRLLVRVLATEDLSGRRG